MSKRFFIVKDYNIVSVSELRETEKSLIQDGVGGKTIFKKSVGKDYIAEKLEYPDKWTHHVYQVYELDSPYALGLIESKNKRVFQRGVLSAIQKRGLTYKEASELNKSLGLGLRDEWS